MCRTEFQLLSNTVLCQWHTHRAYGQRNIIFYILYLNLPFGEVLFSPQFYWEIIDTHHYLSLGFPGGTSGKDPTCQYRWHKRLGFHPGLGRSPREENGNPLQYSCLENPIDRGTLRATVHRVAQSQTQLKWLSLHALYKFKAYNKMAWFPYVLNWLPQYVHLTFIFS